MCKLLTPELFARYKHLKSSKGFTLSNAIQCGVTKPSLGIGLTCGDDECFELFKDLVFPIVRCHTSDVNSKSKRTSKLTKLPPSPPPQAPSLPPVTPPCCPSSYHWRH